MNYILATLSTGLLLLASTGTASAQYRGGYGPYHGGYHGGPSVRIGFGFAPYYGYYPPAYYIAPPVEIIQVPVVQQTPVYTTVAPVGQAVQTEVVRQASATVPVQPPVPVRPVAPVELIYIDGHYQFKR